MKDYKKLKDQVLSKATTIDCKTLHEWMGSDKEPPIIIDVRERDEVDQGIIPGALSIPRGLLEMQVSRYVESNRKGTPIVLYCVNGVRSAFALRALKELNYTNLFSLEGGIDEWGRCGYPVVNDPPLSLAQRMRYKRHILLPEIGEDGQKKLLKSRVLLVGLGGLGSPVAMYLAAAGVGTIGIVDHDLVDISNLQRQIAHSEESVGTLKVDSAADRIRSLNSHVRVETYSKKVTPENIDSIVQGWDLVIDATDSLPTKYLLNDYCVTHSIPYIWSTISEYGGEVMFVGENQACYRCVHPLPSQNPLSRTADANGVLGILPGLCGMLEATEAMKWITGAGENLNNQVLNVDLMTNEYHTTDVAIHPDCPLHQNRSAA